MQIDDGILVPPLPEDYEDQGGCGYGGKYDDEVGFKPVVALALVEDDLQSSEAERYKAEADVIDFGFAELATLEIGRVLNEPRGQQQGNDADRNVDEKNPAPGEVVGDPAAEGRADRRCSDYGDAVNRKGHAAFGGRKGVGKNGLLAGLQAASAGALQHAANDEGGQ